MGVRKLAIAAAVVCAFAGAMPGSASASAACPGDDQLPTSATAANAAFNLACDINALRVREGLQPLRWNWRLWEATQQMADDMAQHHYVSHTESDGRQLLDRVAETGYFGNSDDQLLLENLGWGSAWYSSALATALGWMQSPPHRSNMLDPDLQDLAVGVAQGAATAGGEQGFFYVVDFGALSSAPQAAQSTSPARVGSCRTSKRAGAASVRHKVVAHARRARPQPCVHRLH